MAGGNFTFRNFAIRQEHCAMKVGTDGVLLGAWANGGRRILDIGTGTGLIALMMAQRFEGAEITAVETDHDAALQAHENADDSPYGHRIKVEETPIQQFCSPTPFDAIVANPPYFNASLKNPDSQRATARHTDSLPYSELFGAVKRLLAADGEFSAVIPADCLQAFVAEAYLAGFTSTRQLAIRTTPRKQPKRFLVAFARCSDLPMERGEECLQAYDGSRSQWYGELTKDFYIK